jgi:hypothetical protein
MSTLEERLERAQRGGPGDIRLLVHDPAVEVLEELLRNPFLSEEHLLTLLHRKDLPKELLESVVGNQELIKSQRVKAAVVQHPRTPRLVSLKLMKFLYLFDLVNTAMQPATPAEIKRLAEEQVISRLEQLPLGQQVALARRGTAGVVAALLLQDKTPIIAPALDNPLLTEGALLGVLRRDDLAEEVLEQIAIHPKWSHRYDVRLQLVRHPLTPLGVALGFLPDLKPGDLQVLATDRRMRPTLREYVNAEAERRLRRR